MRTIPNHIFSTFYITPLQRWVCVYSSISNEMKKKKYLQIIFTRWWKETIWTPQTQIRQLLIAIVRRMMIMMRYRNKNHQNTIISCCERKIMILRLAQNGLIKFSVFHVVRTRRMVSEPSNTVYVFTLWKKNVFCFFSSH